MTAPQAADAPAAHCVALLLSSLDAHSAEKLRARLSAPQLAALRRSERQLAALSRAERERLLSALYRRIVQARGRPQRPATAPTPPALLRTPAPGQDTDRIPCSAPVAPPFAFLASASPQTVAELLRSEPPALIALVAAYAPAGAGEAVLGCLPLETRRAVALCIAELRTPAPGVLRCLSDAIEEQVTAAACATEERRRSAAATARALRAAGDEVAREALASLSARRPALAAEVERQLALLSASGPRAARQAPLVPPAPDRPSQEGAAPAWGRSLNAQPAL